MATAKPNILLIVADDLGVDTFHVDDATDTVTVQLTGTGSYPLPNISRLVKDGIHFTRAWAQPICAPTRATLFTGMHPWRTGIGDAAGNPTLPTKLPSDGVTDLQTLANAVADAGYQCGIFGKWDLGDDKATGVPTARGWHRHEGILTGGLRFINQNPPNKSEYEQIIQQDVRYVSWEKVVGDSCIGSVRENIAPEARTYKYATEDEILSARDWIKHVDGNPWWVTLSLLAPHDPFHVPPAGTYTIQFNNPGDPSIQEMFVAMMESMDYYLGEFFNDPSPEIQNQLKEAVIIFVGDNGSQDELDKIEDDDKSSVYIGGVHVPMIIADGGNVFGDAPCYLDTDRMSSEKHAMVHIVDVFQTIIDIAGGSAPSGYTTNSISMLPYLKNTTGDARFTNWQARAYNFGQFFVPSDNINLVARYNNLGEQATISDGTYKLNYRHKDREYEFMELTFNPATDITDENPINNLQHPKAIELWEALTASGGPNYAEVDDKGTKFPPLPGTTPVKLYRYVRFEALSEVNNNPWTTVADFILLDANGNAMDRSAWTVTADSQETEGENGAVSNVVDGNMNTIWHTQWYRQSPSHPHRLEIDLGSAQQISGFKYLPRQNSENGRVKDYQLWASDNNTNWELLTSGSFENTAFVRTVTFPSAGTSTGPGDLYQYVRFVALSEMNNNPWTAVAEFGLLDANGNPVDRSAWTVTADSEQRQWFNGSAHNILDSNAGTIWMTQWSPTASAPPHELRIDLGSAQQISGFKYLPRQDYDYGRIKEYQFFGSQDNTNWVLLASGSFENTAFVRTVTFPSAGTSTAPGSTLPAPMLDRNTFITHLDASTYGFGQVWQDSSGWNNYAAKADGCTMPARYKVVDYNGRSFQAMRFDSAGGMILPENFNLQPPFTIMIVDRYYGAYKGRTLQSRDVNWLLGKWYGQNACFMGNWVHRTSYVAVDNVFTINTAMMDQNHYATWFLNGQLTGNLQGAWAPGRLGLCKGGLYPEVSDADIAAILIWNRVLSDQERQQVEQWLAGKYGVSL